MENKEQISSNPQGICEKFFNAITVTPTFRTLRRISHHPQASHPVPASSSPSLSPPLPLSTNPVSTQNKPGISLEPAHKEKNKVPEVLPLSTKPTKEKELKEKLPTPLTQEKEFKEKPPTPVIQSTQEKTQVAKINPKPDPTPAKVSVQQEKGKANTEVHSASPANAVPEGKTKVVKKVELPQPQPPPKAEDGKKIRSLTSINDKASDYINRARSKIRTTSTVGAGGKVNTSK